MHIKAASAALFLFLAGCAATTPPPRFSAVSPADVDAPEATAPPLAPTLASEAEAKGHLPATPEAAAGDYSCPMHPEVKQSTPGTCPKCGAPLVKSKSAGRQP